MNAKDAERLNKLKGEVETIKTNRAKAEGIVESEKAKLKSNFKITTLDEAYKEKKRLDDVLDRDEKRIVQLLDEAEKILEGVGDA